MSGKKRKKGKQEEVRRWLTKPRLTLAGVVLLGLSLFSLTEYESYSSLYDADYVGSETCGECHTVTYAKWEQSPHAKMARPASAESIVGDFEGGSWTLPAYAQRLPGDDQPAMRTYRQDGAYYMALRHPQNGQFIPFKIDYVIGYQYRQTYLTREEGGVLRRMPLQWSVEQQAYFPYWNLQEKSTPSVADLWAQMTSLNSAWNLFCARCHTTNLVIANKDANHTIADTHWTDAGIGCEACHGPGSHHTNYFEHNYVNRVAAFVNSTLRGQPVAYIANPPRLDKGQDLSTCARCHGPDIGMGTTDVYRIYEPGYSREGRINDLSPYFQQYALQPGRTAPTVEVWQDGTPKGIGMLFRSFIESACYREAEVRCYDCHDPHSNKTPAVRDILEPSEASNEYCLGCHTELARRIGEHSQHEAGTSGSYCYDCHMPPRLQNIVTGVEHWTRTHTMSHVPNPSLTVQLGATGSPNACNICHSDQTAEWAAQWTAEWWP